MNKDRTLRRIGAPLILAMLLWTSTVQANPSLARYDHQRAEAATLRRCKKFCDNARFVARLPADADPTPFLAVVASSADPTPFP